MSPLGKDCEDKSDQERSRAIDHKCPIREPRPHAVAHDGYYGKMLADYAFRHHVKPGITGWAQVQGCRGGTSQIEQMKNRLDHDLWYINNWNIRLDLSILLRTFVEVARHRNAY